MASVISRVGACLAVIIFFPSVGFGQSRADPNSSHLDARGCDGADCPTGAKPLIKGLMSMGDRANDLQDAFSRPNVLAGYVINVTWRQLQPQSVASLDTSVIDASLDKVRRYNHENPGHPLKVVLRVNGAVDAPEWVRTLDGGPVGIKLRVNRNRILEAPLFWTDSYRKAWRNLQARLAARYDPEPLIAQVSNTECAHQTDEPYVNPTDSDSIVALFKAGFTNDKFKACLRNSIQDYDAWKTTRVDFTQNPFETLSVKTDAQGVTTGVYGPLDNQITIAIMRAFRAALGARAIISNHNLAAPPFPVNRTLYAAMKALGGPMQFQTASAGALRPDGTTTGLLKDWDGTIRLGVELGASAIEIWPSVAFHGKPVNDGWNPPPVCRSEIDPHECDGKPVEQLLKWDTELEAVR